MVSHVEDSLKRTSVEKIVEFIFYGDDTGNNAYDSMSLEKRLSAAEQEQSRIIKSLIKDEELLTKLELLSIDIYETYFTIGVKAGAKICIGLLE